jgi:alanyl-tRNA synthetase
LFVQAKIAIFPFNVTQVKSYAFFLFFYWTQVGAEDKLLIDTAYRVVADHIRTLTFAISDGALPSNEGRGYVIRRIARRALRYTYQILASQSSTQPVDLATKSRDILSKLVPVVVRQFQNVYPEVQKNMELIVQVVRSEEQDFLTTLGRGVKAFHEMVERGGNVITGKDAFFLYDTMGFPFDLTLLMAKEKVSCFFLIVDFFHFVDR